MSETVQPVDLLALASVYSDPILVVGRDGRVAAASDAAAREIGCPPAELVSKPLQDLVAAPPDVCDYLRLCRRSRESVIGSIVFRMAPTRAFTVKGARLPRLPSTEGHEVVLRLTPRQEQVKAFLELSDRIDVLNREIIRRRAAEHEVRVNEEWLKTTLLSIGDAVIATDENGRVRFMNQVAERLTGWTSVEAASQPLAEVFEIRNEITGGPATSPVDGVWKTGATVGLANHTILIGRSGRQLPIADCGAPIRDPSGKMIGVVLVFRDVSAQKRIEEERRSLLRRAEQALADAERANRVKNEFLAVLSHELRTPLTAILGWTRLLQMKKVPAERLDMTLEVIERNARQQQQLIEDILDVSRIVSGKLELVLEEVLLTNVIQAARASAQAAADAKGVHLHAAVDLNSRSVPGDPARLQQVVWNLIMNAVKFTPTGGRVLISLTAVDEWMEIAVADTGEGIDAELLGHLFEPFRQEDSSSRRRHGGLGLGLAIVKHLVEMHKGTVHAESAGKGRGATFRVRLPITEKTAAADVQSRARSAGTSLQGVRILLVDDEVDTLNLASAILVDRGAEIVYATSVADAVTQFALRRPDVVISDIGMPGEDGFDLLRRLRTLWKEQRSVPVVALTAFAADEDRRRILKEGFATYLSKPIEPDDLVSAIATLMQK
jgi:PAS domain S-box-containing protein